MKTSRVMGISIVMLIAGLAIGGYGGISYVGSIFNGLSTISTVNQISTRLYVLELLRSGKLQKAIDLEESFLDGDLMIVGLHPQDALPNDSLKILQRTAEYRSKYPRSNSPEVQDSIDRALKRGS